MTLPPAPNLADDPADEFQGDAHAADIVSPTGEEMPAATHAEVHAVPDPDVADDDRQPRNRSAPKVCAHGE